ncbi:MinD/ParA family protein [Lederbergia wuyishanensis]|uniref:Flagellar biosynthesis protein FlhG n=1 Tax=Lederbergia wuyishanensis TaxID=1347903 RepID=A0ABU0CZT7_9BACI|nr:MinD/ParA family protein [Lederbergia wuyishanensis]MCJ8006283.1 MinD/ParA family protein [Lederbergia wuyishanensis]MDQ0341652.1 flagellar biosynthesis protein FlhG [Lederbergia wuyishanensis]
MKDQAEKLRLKMTDIAKKSQAKTIAVVSGKGGVGKSNISINIAMLLNKKGNKVLLFDFDIGMGNVNILLGKPSRLTLSEFLHEEATLKDLINDINEGVSYIAAGNGLNETIDIDERMLTRLLEGLKDLQHQYDYIIFDMGAGATSASLKVLLAVEDIIVITTPEPTAITDAYSMMKFICLEGATGNFFLICNRADNEKQGRETLERLKQTALKFLHKEVASLGILPEDSHVRKAVINQTAFSVSYPKSSISIKLENLVRLYLDEQNMDDSNKAEDSFIHRLRRFFF